MTGLDDPWVALVVGIVIIGMALIASVLWPPAISVYDALGLVP